MPTLDFIKFSTDPTANTHAHETYDLPYEKFSTNIALLSETGCNIVGLLDAFNTYFTTVELQDEPLDDIVIEEMSTESPLPSPFTTPLGKTKIDALPASTIAERNFKYLANIIFNRMHLDGKEQQLSYHIISHALEMSHDTAYLAEQMEMSNWKLLLACAGLCHDAPFTRKRGADETQAAHGVSRLFTLFLNSLTEQQNKYFNALIETLIIGGTLPVFFRKNPPIASKDPLYFFTLWEIYYTENRAVANNLNLKELFKACMSMTLSDTQRSLMPTVLTAFPGNKPYLNTLTNISPSLTGIIKAVYASTAAIAPDTVAAISENTYLSSMLTLLGQSFRMLCETFPQSMTTLLPAQIKLNWFLRTGEFRNSAGETEELTAAEVDSLWAQCLSGESFFAQLNIDSLAEKPFLRELLPAEFLFLQPLWKWQKEVYRSIIASSSNHKNIIEALATNARFPQGLTVIPADLVHAIFQDTMADTQTETAINTDPEPPPTTSRCCCCIRVFAAFFCGKRTVHPIDDSISVATPIPKSAWG